MLQCYNATLFSTCRKGLPKQRNPLPTRTSARIFVKPSRQLPPGKMSHHSVFRSSSSPKKSPFHPQKHACLTKKTLQNGIKMPSHGMFLPILPTKKKHFFWRVKQRQPPDFCPVFDTQNRKIAKKRCRFSVAPQPRHKKSVGIFLHRHRKNSKLGSGGRWNVDAIMRSHRQRRTVARSHGRTNVRRGFAGRKTGRCSFNIGVYLPFLSDFRNKRSYFCVGFHPSILLKVLHVWRFCTTFALEK